MPLSPRHRLRHSPDTTCFLDDERPQNQPQTEPIPAVFQPHPGQTFRWFCTRCQEDPECLFWWQSPGGILCCWRCNPPNLPTTVVAMGTRDEAPLVTALYGRSGSPQPSAAEMATWTRPRPFRWLLAGFLDRRPEVAAYWSDASGRGRCLRCHAETRSIAPDGFCLACHAEDDEL